MYASDDKMNEFLEHLINSLGKESRYQSFSIYVLLFLSDAHQHLGYKQYALQKIFTLKKDDVPFQSIRCL
jgi:hypothetical protein